MPPKAVSVDGIKGPATPADSANRPGGIIDEIKKDSEQAPIKRSEALNAEIKKELQKQPVKTNVANQVNSSKVDHGPTVTILLTLIAMVLLIGLAYFAYNKSK